MSARRLVAAFLVLGVVMSPEAPAGPDTVPPSAVAQLAKDGAVLLDVRTQEEWDEGHVKGAKLATWQTLTAATPALPKDKNAPIVTYCRSGARAQLAAQKLRGLGYTRVVSVAGGGFAELEEAGMKTEK